MSVDIKQFYKIEGILGDVQDECDWASEYIEELLSHWDKMSPFELKETLGEIAERLDHAARQEKPND